MFEALPEAMKRRVFDDRQYRQHHWRVSADWERLLGTALFRANPFFFRWLPSGGLVDIAYTDALRRTPRASLRLLLLSMRDPK